ncbi:hypothetical protein [Nocardia sp. NPDC047654]|uniref:sigma-70 region 4 domain-containing protein n=1 Tax=Nocardia sp. NPDC047654 TaxID=3364314 RepID=UPI0037108AA0
MTKGPDKAQPDERERQRKALELRLEGKSYDDIAAVLGWADRSGAYRAVEAILKRTESETVAEYREVVGARLEALHAAYWPAALAGDYKAAEIVGKTSDRLAKLYGMNAPDKVQVQPVGLDHEAFTTRVEEDIRTLGLDPVGDVPLIDHGQYDENGEPWANTGDIPGRTAAGRKYVPSTRVEADPETTADNQTKGSDSPSNSAGATLSGHTVGTLARNRWDARPGERHSTWADVLG